MFLTDDAVDAGVALIFYSALVGARDSHVFPVLRDRAASDLDALRLEDAGDLLVGQRPGGIFLFNETLHPALEDQQRRAAALRTVDALAEEVPKFEDALRRVSVLVGHGTAHGRGMHANLFGDLFDHHRLQVVDAMVEKLALPLKDGVADTQDGLLALLD